MTSARRLSRRGRQFVLFLVGTLGQAAFQPALGQPVRDVGLRGTRQVARQFVAVELGQRALQALVEHRRRQRTLAVHQQPLQQADDFRGVVGSEQLPLGLFAQMTVTGDAFAMLHAAKEVCRADRDEPPRTAAARAAVGMPARRGRRGAGKRLSACRPLR
ncbi:hypothetical protein G6F59_017043 [Rhizopus arrhizus]|nr:hypothetical protein G6F59_017043 [Rhizopus arrhizus]